MMSPGSSAGFWPPLQVVAFPAYAVARGSPLSTSEALAADVPTHGATARVTMAAPVRRSTESRMFKIHPFRARFGPRSGSVSPLAPCDHAAPPAAGDRLPVADQRFPTFVITLR